jgi:hypothetical protein
MLTPAWEYLSGPMQYSRLALDRIADGVSEVRLCHLVRCNGSSRHPQAGRRDRYLQYAVK